MTPKSKLSSAVADRASNNGSNPERERVFSAYRQFGYLEGDLDPLGFLRPRPTPSPSNPVKHFAATAGILKGEPTR